MTSCSSLFYTYTQVPVGKSIHEKFINKNKNEVLKEYGLPDKKGSDEAGGQVFVYEEKYINSITKSSRDYSVVRNIFGQNNTSVSGSDMTNIGVNKKFVNFFFNKSGKVYYYKSNYGEIYRTDKKFKKREFTVFGSVSGALVLAGIIAIFLPR